jgi:hypothetical protein
MASMPGRDDGYNRAPVSDSWSAFLDGSAGSGHAVHVYGEVRELAETASAYLAAGFDRGEPALVVATPEHWSSFAAALRARDWPADRLERERLLFLEDADAVLAAVATDQGPSWARFEAVIGGVIDRIGEQFSTRPIRAFGEAVNLLCERGDSDGAVALEACWNRLIDSRRFSLLCGYHVDPFDRSTQVSVLPGVCRAHSHVLPADDPNRFQRAVDAALEEALGRDAGKVYALVGEQARATNVPEAQLALMWVSANMPTNSERILGAARTHYARSAVAEPA